MQLQKKIVSKIINLYHIFSRNAIGLLLLAALFFNISFTNAKEKTNSKIRTIVIDPGHGGHDPGNLGTGRYKTTEKHIALDISLKLGAYIAEAFPEIKVIYTRSTNDKFLELGERTQLANDNNADLFISVHCDAFTNPDAYGAGVYVMGMSKLKANMDVAMKENAVIYLEDDYKENYDGFDPNTPESYIIFSLKQNTHLDQSLQIAEEVEQQFATRANRKSRGVKQAPFYVISYANMPSILIECGFLTNPKEEDFLHSDKGQDYLASAIFRAFRGCCLASAITTAESALGSLISFSITASISSLDCKGTVAIMRTIISGWYPSFLSSQSTICFTYSNSGELSDERIGTYTVWGKNEGR